ECTAPYDQPLALTTTNLFEANHEDAYDSDLDEGPYASAAFMANLSSTCGTNGSSSSHINEVQISDDLFFSDVSYSLDQEMQQKEHLNSEVDSMLDDNMITYDEYQNDSGVEAVPTVGYDEHKLVNATLTAELERCKIEMQALECNKVLSEKKTLEDMYLEEIVVLKNANKVATNVLKGFQMPTHTIPMLSKRPNFAPHDLHKTSLGYSSPMYDKQARIAQHALYDGNVLLNMNHPPTRVHDSEESLVHAEVYKIKMAE
nr:hypothetical protein [Tanacetum cinerariifolium]